MVPLLFAIPLAAQLLVLAADQVPKLNVRPSCAAVAVRDAFHVPPEVCLRAENEARTTLSQHWNEYSAAARGRCLQLSTTGDCQATSSS
jgi:hypothetical protein